MAVVAVAVVAVAVVALVMKLEREAVRVWCWLGALVAVAMGWVAVGWVVMAMVEVVMRMVGWVVVALAMGWVAQTCCIEISFSSSSVMVTLLTDLLLRSSSIAFCTTIIGGAVSCGCASVESRLTLVQAAQSD